MQVIVLIFDTKKECVINPPQFSNAVFLLALIEVAYFLASEYPASLHAVPQSLHLFRSPFLKHVTLTAHKSPEVDSTFLSFLFQFF